MLEARGSAAENAHPGSLDFGDGQISDLIFREQAQQPRGARRAIDLENEPEGPRAVAASAKAPLPDPVRELRDRIAPMLNAEPELGTGPLHGCSQIRVFASQPRQVPLEQPGVGPDVSQQAIRQRHGRRQSEPGTRH